MNSDVSQVFMTWCNYTWYPCININHNCHWYEKRSHSREYYIAFVLVISTFLKISSSWFVPEKRKEKESERKKGKHDVVLLPKALNFHYTFRFGHKFPSFPLVSVTLIRKISANEFLKPKRGNGRILEWMIENLLAFKFAHDSIFGFDCGLWFMVLYVVVNVH